MRAVGSRSVWIYSLLVLAVLVSATLVPATAPAQSPSQDEILERLERLEKNQANLYKQLDSKDARIKQLESELEKIQGGKQAPGVEAPALAQPPIVETEEVAAAPTEEKQEPQFLGSYDFGKGFSLARTEWGSLNFSAYTYVRYLNQKAINGSYTNHLGQKINVDRRNDVQLNKVTLYFKGWLLDPNFHYLLYVWTANPSQGLGAQVVGGGNLTYHFADAFTLGGGIAALPTVRSNRGSWPYFLGVDKRMMADEYFRGSYTQGFFALGTLARGLKYNVMLGNNLSNLGVDAGQLDGDFTTLSAAMWWMPTTGEFGYREAFGDYDEHKELATTVGLQFTRSPEDRQSQPGTEAPDNTQIRISDGTPIFNPGAFGDGLDLRKATYYMTSFDAGMKIHGFSLEGEYYWRWVNDFKANAKLPTDSLFDHGFQLQTSMMLWPKTLQVYGNGSYIFGQYDNPWELAAGINWWMFERREVRWNFEYIYADGSPVGYLAIPLAVGATGSIFHTNLEMYF